MVDEVKFSQAFSGLRGKSINVSQLYDLLAKLSAFAFEQREFISEIDLNPIIATTDQLVIVDARIILKQ